MTCQKNLFFQDLAQPIVIVLFFVTKEQSMGFVRRIFRTKEKTEALTVREDIVPQVDSQGNKSAFVVDAWRYQQVLSMLDRLIHPSVVGNNFIEMFNTIPEVFWPIDFIAKRISEAHFDLKRVKDDSLVWCNRLGADTILKQPNPIMTWREIVYQHFVYKLATGNAFFRAAMPENITADAIKFQWCSNYWSLPAHLIQVKPMEYSYGVPMFGIASIEELIKGYTLDLGAYSGLTIPYYQIWHDRDGIPELIRGNGYLKAPSRLLAVKKPIANLIAVYEARNVIYLKRGALGFVVAQKVDETGTVALEPKEKEELREQINSKYGVGEGQSPWAITDIPVNFIRTNLSIQELQPFDETLEDAIKIASVFGIPSVLVPRKDQSTFSNQDTAEKSVYTSVIIPAAKRFCEALTTFLGLDQKGLYLDCDFSDVACLQVGIKESEEVKKLVNERCLSQFNNGIISINDWRSQIHEDALEGEIFDKTKFEMTPDEIAKVDSVIKAQTSPIQINTGQTGEKNTDNNQPKNKPSKGESNERTDD